MSNQKKVEWLLRIGVAGEFVGHGLLAIGQKTDWINWIKLLIHVDTATATILLVIVGGLDVIMAVLVLAKPVRPLLLWMALWGFFTALLRPIVMYLGVSNVNWLDFIERFANWAAPLALYYVYKMGRDR